MSTISASTTSTTAYKVAADTTGTLVLQTGATPTTALTLGTDQSATFAGAVNAPNTFGFKNRIINGAMMIDQRNAGASVSVTSIYTLDRWKIDNSTDGTLTAQQVVDAPTGFYNSLKVTVGTADTVVGASQFSQIMQIIEGTNIADLGWGAAGASAVTLSFWVKSSTTGLYGGSILNSALNRSYVFSYTISSANTWEQKTITISGDTSGTWLKTNGHGIGVYFNLLSGSTYQGTANAWSSSLYIAPTGQTNLFATSGNTFQITGVQFEKGSTATSFDYRPYGTELALCQRYYMKFSNDGGVGEGGIATGYQVALTAAAYNLTLPVTMRAEPTGSSANLQSTDQTNFASDATFNNIFAAYSSVNIVMAFASNGAVLRPSTLFIKSGTTGYLALSAEL